MASPSSASPASNSASIAPDEPLSQLITLGPAPIPLPTVQSVDGRFVLTDTYLLVNGQRVSFRELERAEVAHVRWVLWVLLGGLGLAAVLIAFLQNWLHTLPAALGMVATAALLAYGQRGTNRLRLWRLGPQLLHQALPGELATWQRLVAELNRRIARAHDQAAAEAATLLAAAEAAQAATVTAAAAPAADEPTPLVS